jgi:peptidoglycan-associated lipoprotein
MRTVNLLSALSLVLLLTACGSQPPAPEQSSAPAQSAPETTTATPSKVDSFDPMSVAALKDPRSPLSKRSVYFDFDSYIIKDEFQSLLATHAKFLSANASMKMLIQGNADERGSREYNLALGQKRAEAVRKALEVMGVSNAQVEAISFGEEKPLSMDDSETAWAENRRAELNYTAGQPR